MIRYVVKMFRGTHIGNFVLLYNDNKMLISFLHLRYFCQDYRNVD
jgi:hypothetical protein